MKVAGKVLLIIIFSLGCFELIVQFYLIIANRSTSLAEAIIRYFCFFTILTNLLVTICASALLFSKSGNFFTKPHTINAVAVYITIVSIVYNVILRSLWRPQGLQLLVDELLHVIVPLLFIIYTIKWIHKTNITFGNVFTWLLYPLAYLIIILIRGAFSHYYPYPFINVSVLGYSQVLINSTGMLGAFLFVSILFLGINKLK